MIYAQQSSLDLRFSRFFAIHTEICADLWVRLDEAIRPPARQYAGDDLAHTTATMACREPVPACEPLRGPAVYGLSHEGRIHIDNEDAVAWGTVSDDIQLLAVADGVSATSWGEIASAYAVHSLFACFNEALARHTNPGKADLRRLIYKATLATNAAVHRLRETCGDSMSTTLCAAVVRDNTEAYIVNIGDSRAYVLRNGRADQITRDHKVTEGLVADGVITAEESRYHPWRNILSRVVGRDPDVDIDVFHVKLAPGDRLLLCSDGLWEELTTTEIAGILNVHKDNQVACEELVYRANQGGGRDNITCLLWDAPAPVS